MANKSLTDLTARTATADSDLLHINSGGTDYKQTKARFCNDIVQYIDFANTSSLTGQCDTLGSTVKSPAYFAGKINSYGHQSACGTPENNSYHVLLSIYSGNYHELTITDVDTGAIWRKLKINGTWQSSWTMSPTRNEITSLNNSLTNSFKVGTITQTTGSSGHLSLGKTDSNIYVLCAWTKTAYGMCVPFTDTNGNWYIKIIAWNSNSYTPIANTSVTVNYVYKDLT